MGNVREQNRLGPLFLARLPQSDFMFHFPSQIGAALIYPVPLCRWVDLGYATEIKGSIGRCPK